MKKDKNYKFKRKLQKAEFGLDDAPSNSKKMQYYKTMRRTKRIKNNIFLLHSFIKFIAIIGMLWFCSRLMICKFWYMPQNAFDTYPNKHVRIIGNKITPNAKIVAALKTRPIPKIPIYMINTIPYEKEMQKLSPVKKAFVRRYWLPARFEVTIEEEIPVITVSPSPHAPEIAALTREGRIISKEYLPIDVKKYKTYKILTYDEFKNWSNDEIYHIMILAQRIEDFSGEKLVYLDIRNKKDVFAQLETIKIRIGELNSTLKERIERLSSVMPQIEELKRQTDYVDLRWDNTTYLKKRAKGAPYTEPQLTPQQIEQSKLAEKSAELSKKEAEKAKAEHSEKVKSEPDKNTTVKKSTLSEHLPDAVNTQKNSAPPKVVAPEPKKVQTLPKPSKPKASAPQKTSEPQALPNIEIQIVEP